MSVQSHGVGTFPSDKIILFPVLLIYGFIRLCMMRHETFDQDSGLFLKYQLVKILRILLD